MHKLSLQEFPGLSVSTSALYRHPRTSCALYMKKLKNISVVRKSEETSKKRKKTILQYLADKRTDLRIFR